LIIPLVWAAVVPALCSMPLATQVPAAAKMGVAGPSAAKLPAGDALLTGVRLEDCEKLLAGSTDEEKFAGLLLVTKVAQPDDPGTLRRVLRAVGMKFIYRLLSSPGGPGGADENSLMYQCMALNVLSSFCTLQELWPDMHAEADFVRMAPWLLKSLQTNGVLHPAVDSALACLACLAASDACTRTLCKHHAPAAIADFMQSQRDEEPERKDRALFVLDSLLTPVENPSATAEAVPKIAQVLVEGKGMIRLDLLPRLARVLRCRDPSFADKLQATGRAWHSTVRGALMNLLQNKLPSNHRKHILAVALTMCEHFGQAWALPRAPAGASCADGTFVHLLVGITNIELRLRVEEALKPEGTQFTCCTGTKVRILTQISEDNVQVVPIALALLEKTLQYLSEGGEAEDEDGSAGVLTKTPTLERWSDMEAERLLKMKRDLDEAVDAVFIYLQDLQVLSLPKFTCCTSTKVQILTLMRLPGGIGVKGVPLTNWGSGRGV
jgi:hypothetical protein